MTESYIEIELNELNKIVDKLVQVSNGIRGIPGEAITVSSILLEECIEDLSYYLQDDDTYNPIIGGGFI